MRNFLLRVIINAVAIALTAAVLPGISIADNSITTLLIIAVIFGVVNAIIKPILKLLTCPLIFLTLGLFLLVINGLLLLLTEALSGNRLLIDGFWWAVLGGFIMGVVGIVLEGVLGLDDGGQRTGARRYLR